MRQPPAWGPRSVKGRRGAGELRVTGQEGVHWSGLGPHSSAFAGFSGSSYRPTSTVGRGSTYEASRAWKGHGEAV